MLRRVGERRPRPWNPPERGSSGVRRGSALASRAAMPRVGWSPPLRVGSQPGWTPLKRPPKTPGGRASEARSGSPVSGRAVRHLVSRRLSSGGLRRSNRPQMAAQGDHRFGWRGRHRSESVDSIPRYPRTSSGGTPSGPSCGRRDAKKLLSPASVNSERAGSRTTRDIRVRHDRNARSRHAKCRRFQDGSIALWECRRSTGYRSSGGRAPGSPGCARRVDRSISAAMDGTRGRWPPVCGGVDGGAFPGGPVSSRTLTCHYCPHTYNTPEARPPAPTDLCETARLAASGSQ